MKKKLVSTRKKGISARRIRKFCYIGLLGLTYLILAPFMLKQLWNSQVKASENTEIPMETLPEETQAESESIPEDAEQETEVITLPEEEELALSGPLEFVESDASYFDDALIIGDSRTVGLCNYGTLPNADYFCTGGLAAYEILEGKEIDGFTLQQTLEYNNYGKVYLMVGLNETAFGLDEFHENITEVYQMIEQKCPNALIFMMANLHVSAQVSVEQPAISNDKINTANQYIEELTDGIHSFYIDVNPLFDDEDQCLDEEYSDDGIHVSGSDYATWTDWLCTQTITEESKPKALETFCNAVEALKNDQHVTRQAWENTDIYLLLSVPEVKNHADAEVMPYIAVKTADNKLIPWLASQEDLLADDWIILN